MSYNGLRNPEVVLIQLSTELPPRARDVRCDAAFEWLTVANGQFREVSVAVSLFEASGTPVVQKWLGYRIASGSGRSASSATSLDQIRPAK